MPRLARLALLAAGVVVVVLVVAQLALPALAERRLRHALEPYGQVDHVAIRAFPALKLLWHRADRVTVAMRDYTSPQGPIGDFVARTRATGDLDVQVGTLRSGPVVLRDARLTKRGDALTGSARLEQADLRRALPPELDVRPVAAGGQGIVLQGTASALGVGVQAEVRLRAAGGAVVVAPEGLPIASLTVFSDPRVDVQALGARLQGGAALLAARAVLR
jgi:hypothetical protein